jgi:hypothetical protein
VTGHAYSRFVTPAIGPYVRRPQKRALPYCTVPVVASEVGNEPVVALPTEVKLPLVLIENIEIVPSVLLVAYKYLPSFDVLRESVPAPAGKADPIWVKAPVARFKV